MNRGCGLTRVARCSTAAIPMPRAAFSPRSPATPIPSSPVTPGCLIGTVRYRLDDEEGAMAAWKAAAARGGGSASWLGWRSMAEQQVRDGDLPAAIESYREADRSAPPEERGAIANRIAWLLKETGHDFAARRQFNRARGPYATQVPFVTYAIIGICLAVFGIDAILSGGESLANGLGPIGANNLINAGEVAEGRVVAHLHQRVRPPRPHPPRLQHVRPVPLRPDRRAPVRALRVRRDLPAVRGRREHPHHPRRSRRLRGRRVRGDLRAGRAPVRRVAAAPRHARARRRAGWWRAPADT